MQAPNCSNHLQPEKSYLILQQSTYAGIRKNPFHLTEYLIHQSVFGKLLAQLFITKLVKTSHNSLLESFIF